MPIHIFWQLFRKGLTELNDLPDSSVTIEDILKLGLSPLSVFVNISKLYIEKGRRLWMVKVDPPGI